MQAIAYEGYNENGKFVPFKQPIQKTGKVRAILTVLNEPVKDDYIQADDSFTTWHMRLKELIADSMDEELPDLVRSKVMRPPINFNE